MKLLYTDFSFIARPWPFHARSWKGMYPPCKQQRSRDSLHLHVSVSSACFCEINMSKQAFNVHFYEKHVILQKCPYVVFKLTFLNQMIQTTTSECFY